MSAASSGWTWKTVSYIEMMLLLIVEMHSFFPLCRLQQASYVTIIAWNVNAVCTKFEKSNVLSLLFEYDVICLNEVKTPLPVSSSGYVSFKSAALGTTDRGGRVVCVKNWLADLLAEVDTSNGYQVWLRFRNIQDVLYGFCYIPPCDSQYYSHDLFAVIQEKLTTRSVETSFVIVGGINALFGRSVRDILNLLELSNAGDLSYPYIPDEVQTPSDNAELFVCHFCW